MATCRIIAKNQVSTQNKWFNLAGFSFKEILSDLRRFYSSFKEMREIGSESPAIDHQQTDRLPMGAWSVYKSLNVSPSFEIKSSKMPCLLKLYPTIILTSIFVHYIIFKFQYQMTILKHLVNSTSGTH